MTFGYLARVAVTSLALLFSLPDASPGHQRLNAGPHRRKHRATAAIIDPDAMFSRRALRRARLILEMRLLELRKAKLDRVEHAIEEHLPIDRILEEDSPAPRAH